MQHMTKRHWTVVAAFLTALSVHLATHETWADAFSPVSVAAIIGQGGAFLTALLMNKPGAAARKPARRTGRL